MKKQVHGGKLLLSAGIAVGLAVSMLATGRTANAAGIAPVALGTAADFAVLAGTTVTNTGPTTVTGDLGVHPGSAVTGFPPGNVTGTTHKADSDALQAKNDLVLAYDDAAGRIPSTDVPGGALDGLTLVPGVYKATGAILDLTGTLTLDGQNDPSSVWVFQTTSSLITASASSVKLIRGASSCNVFWQVVSSATLGSGSTFMGTIMALTSITMADGATVHGRALARNGLVSLIGNTVTTTCLTSPTEGASPSASASTTTSLSPSPSPAPISTATPPATGIADVPSSNNSTPLFALLICLAFGGLGMAAVEAQRRRIRS